MRTLEQELELRKRQRESYFENPQYRKWSDISSVYNIYADCSEMGFIAYYLLGDCDTIITLSAVRAQLENGKQLPINWDAIYDYCDERYNDDDNYLLEEFYHGLRDWDTMNSQSLIALLSEYREKLLHYPYDMV